MAVAEFDLIRRYFDHAPRRAETRLGVGDDCALLNLPAGYQLALTTDTMVEGVHFFAGTDPEALGHKLLAVNLSDLAAMGAEPLAVTLNLTLPRADETWIQAFARGFLALAQQFNVDLIGGDTTSGPLSLSVQALGKIAEGKALLRSGAKPGDGIYVTGLLGEAGLGLKIEQGWRADGSMSALERFHRPMPRVAEGLALLGVANSCIDISDGLASDLGHILERSGVGAILDWGKLPLSSSVRNYVADSGDYLMPLTAGDDYELCFTVSAAEAKRVPPGCVRVGVIEAEPGLRLRKDGGIQLLQAKGYEHFS